MKPGSGLSVKGFSLLPALFLVLSSALLAACDGTTTTPGGPNGVNVGTADAFGSLVVNGIRYNTAGASIVIDNAAGRAESELAVGMRVIVTGPFNEALMTGDADRVEVETALRGPLNDNGIDFATNRMVVLGQAVLVLPTTTFDNVSGLEELRGIQDNGALNAQNPGIEVHGAFDGSGRVHASFIRKTSDDFPADGAVRMKGVVNGLQDNTFRIGTMNVAFAGAVPGLDNGAFVEVEGTFAPGPPPAVAAVRVTVLNPSLGPAGEDARLDGYVRSTPSSTSFAVTGPGGPVTVGMSISTQFVNGFKNDLGPGDRVRIEGSVTESGMSARRVFFLPSNPVAMEAVVDSVDAAGETMILMGKTVVTDEFTQFKDNNTVGVRAFRLGDIGPNSTVRVVGHDNGTTIVAARVERTRLVPPNPPNLVTLQGPATGITFPISPAFFILGVSVFTGTTSTDYFDENGALIPGTPIQAQSSFFSLVVDNTVIEIRQGLLVGGTVVEPLPPLRMEVHIQRIND